MRVGQKNGVVRQWARTGTRPRQPKDQRYKSAYLFGAICPARGTGAAVVMPAADTMAMQRHLEEIAQAVSPGAVAVLLMDRAGWHIAGELAFPDHVHRTQAVGLHRSSSMTVGIREVSDSAFGDCGQHRGRVDSGCDSKP